MENDRPYSQFKTHELELLFNKRRGNLSTLTELQKELGHRSKKRAIELLKVVNEEITKMSNEKSYSGQWGKWVITSGLIHFTELSVSKEPVSVYTIGWRFGFDSDWWSRLVIDFKNGRVDVRPQVKIKLKEAIQKIVNLNGLNIHQTGIVSAIPHSEFKLPNLHPFYESGIYLESELGIKFLNKYLVKSKHDPLHKAGPAVNRDALVNGVYKFINIPEIHNFITIDDLVTRGSTMRDIRRAICVTNHDANVIGLALARHEGRADRNRYKMQLDNSHIQKITENQRSSQ